MIRVRFSLFPSALLRPLALGTLIGILIGAVATPLPALAERVLPDIFVPPANYNKAIKPLLALEPLPDAKAAPASAQENTAPPAAPPTASPTADSPAHSPAAPAPSASDTPMPLPQAASPLPSAEPAPSAASAPPAPASIDKPTEGSGFMPPPLSDKSLQNAVQNEQERAYYEAKRKRISDTFEKAYEGLVPLGPNEVRDVMGRYERTQRSAVPPSTGQPRGQVRIKTLSLEPGSDPPTVNVSAGYVTTITIVDATGEPWPIMDIGIGGNFEVTKTNAGQGATHVVRIMPLTRFGFGNLSVVLQDLPTPIIFKLASGGSSVDYRFDARVPKLGPNAKISLIDQRRRLEAGSSIIMTFLDNAPPPDAKRVKVSGADSRTIAWLMNDRMFIRTPLTMLSPSWDASVSSADGTTVYEMKETPALLMSDSGILVRARVMPKDDE